MLGFSYISFPCMYTGSAFIQKRIKYVFHPEVNARVLNFLKLILR